MGQNSVLPSHSDCQSDRISLEHKAENKAKQFAYNHIACQWRLQDSHHLVLAPKLMGISRFEKTPESAAQAKFAFILSLISEPNGKLVIA